MKNLILIAILFNSSIFADYSNHKDSKEVIDELVNEHGFEESYVINILKQAKKRKTALNSVARPAEKTKTWDDYRTIFLKKKRISDGKKFIQTNITVLERAEKEFGVPKEVITAILGVETDYGNIMGSYRAVSYTHLTLPTTLVV